MRSVLGANRVLNPAARDGLAERRLVDWCSRTSRRTDDTSMGVSLGDQAVPSVDTGET
jgi:hypothetical protein